MTVLDAQRRGGARTRFDAPGGCPACAAPQAEVRVLETRRRADGSLRRRRSCRVCQHRWTTAEAPGEPSPTRGLPVRQVVREVEVRVPVPVAVPAGMGEEGAAGAPWWVVEAAALSGAPVFVEYDPSRRVWLCALTDELNPAEGESPAAAIRLAESGLRRLIGRAG